MSKEFVVVGDDRVVHSGDSLSAAAIIAGDSPGAAVFQRVEIGDGKEEMARFDDTMREIQAEADGIRRPAEAAQRTIGLVVIDVPNDRTFKPTSPDSVPASKANGLPMGELGKLAILLNAGEWTVQRRLWAAVADNGNLLLLPCPVKERPSDPTSFPPRTRVYERDTGKAVATAENNERLSVAYLPRTWTLQLRPLSTFAE
ncbi:MAG: hypothetical protein KF777_00160 [Planctomycetaceae bacterium]|nr:hypothetical protein [Planctomycetaceae bacterium]